jgi:hypothetical protein
MSETTETTKSAEEVGAPDAAAEAVDQPEAEAPADEPEAEAPAEAPEAQDEEELEVEPDEPAAAVSAEAVDFRVARVWLCERGHRTTTLWSTPTTCRARPLRRGPECGRQLYPIGELPDQVKKALNPIKASRKSSKK